MDQKDLRHHLKKLEQSIRLSSRGTDWLMLEPVNPDLLSDLSYIREVFDETDPATNRTEDRQQVQPPAGSEPPAEINAETALPEPPAPERPPRENAPAIVDLDPLEATNLDSLRLRLRNCSRCKLCQNRSTVVFGQGNQKATVVFIGEAPGEEEDRTGLAFVGKAGKLLTQLIHSIGLNREDVYICNIIKCRPPGNRNPESAEIDSCFPFVTRQLELLQPKLIVTMGNIATKSMLPNALGIMKMRGQIIDFNGVPLIPTFHPSYLLRNQSALADVWTDMRKIRQIIHQQASKAQS